MPRVDNNPHLLSEAHAANAEDFLDLLMPHRSGPLWDRVDAEGWIFRGQRDADWDLTPSALRVENALGNQPFTKFKAAQIRELPYGSLKEQIDHEEAFVLEFAGRASIAGYEIPGDRPELRVAELAVKRHSGREFPPLAQRWIYALAQHYLVPTRLLDWTTPPLVAAYFAAQEAACAARKAAPTEKERLAVWAVSRPFIEQCASSWNPGPVIVTVPTTSNPNLHAQGGLFTLVRFANNSKRVGRPPSLDNLFRNRRSEVRVKAMRAPHWQFPLMFKVTLPCAEAPMLMHYLHLHGVDAAAVYPGLKSVAQAMMECKLRSSVRPSRHAKDEVLRSKRVFLHPSQAAGHAK